MPENLPEISDYDKALKRAKYCLIPPHLRTGIVHQDSGGPTPVVWAKSGTFAVVYRLDVPGTGRKAIRCFLTKVNDHVRKRYEDLNTSLPKNAGGYTVSCTFRDPGVKVDGKGTFPFIEMDFVEGRTLIDEVEGLTQTKNQAAIRSLCGRWRDLMASMDRVSMAHGDLSGENVMVRKDGSLVLIDYDGVYFKTLAKYPPDEKGNPKYQHRDANSPDPSRCRPYGPRMDDFSALAIYIALLAFAEAPSLFKKYANPTDGKLLYEAADLRDPRRSEVFRDLSKLGCPDIKRLLPELERACVGPIAGCRPFLSLVDPAMNLRAIAALVPPNWRRIDSEATVVKQHGCAIPTELASIVAAAEQRCRTLDGLKSLLGEKPRRTRKIKADFEAAKRLLDDWDEARATVTECGQCVEQTGLLEDLQSAIRTDASHRTFIRLWKQYESRLRDGDEWPGLGQQAQTWADKIDAYETLVTALGSSPPSDVRIAEAWEALEKIGGHPDAVPHAQRAADAVKRRNRLVAGRNILKQPLGEKCDRELIREWIGLPPTSFDLTPNEKREYQEAKRRIDYLDALDAVVQRVDAGRSDGEDDVIAAAAKLKLPAGYAHDRPARSERVERAGRRVDTRRVLTQALGAMPVSDCDLSRAWEKAIDPSAWGGPGPSNLPAGAAVRIELAVKRSDKLRRLKESGVPAGYQVRHAHEHDDKLLGIWDQALLASCSDADPWRGCHAAAKVRREFRDRVAAAITANNRSEIARASEAECLRDFQWPPDRRRIIDEAQMHVRTIRTITDVLDCRDRAAFRDVFDARVIRENAAEFERYLPLLRDWIPSEVVLAEDLGLARPPLGDAITADRESMVRIRWRWPDPRFADQCVIAICPVPPDRRSKPKDAGPLFWQQIGLTEYNDDGSFLLTVEPGWFNGHLSVWAVVNIGGDDMFYSEPLDLGSLETPPVQATAWPKFGGLFS